jgi:hypothetical protein
MSRKISSKEKEGLLRAAEYVLLGLHRFISHDLNNEEIDYEEHFKEGETITLDQMLHFFQDRSGWFFWTTITSDGIRTSQAKKILDAAHAKKPIFDPQIFDPQIADDFCDLIKMGEGIIKRRKYND